jgi:polyhydroxybutyrate depolymerase
VDTSRTYATGLSNGAFMSSVLACTRSETFAAVAPVAGVVHPPDCAPDRPVPLLGLHGTADPLLPFNGSVSAGALAGIESGGGVTTTAPPPADLDGAGYPASTAQWASANGCRDHTDDRIADSVVRRVWDCPEGGEVAFLMIEGGGHTWPGSDALTGEEIVAIVGPTNMEIDATALAWEFFGGHRLAG